jgi:hypothetical protein
MKGSREGKDQGVQAREIFQTSDGAGADLTLPEIEYSERRERGERLYLCDTRAALKDKMFQSWERSEIKESSVREVNTKPKVQKCELGGAVYA